jgi:hypothetical protein
MMLTQLLQLVLRHSFSAAATDAATTTTATGATATAGANGTAAATASSSGTPSRPHCVALHPDGHSVALGFASHTALYFITAACSTAAAAVGGTVVLSSATTTTATAAGASAAASGGVDEQQQQSEVQLSELQLRADQEVLMCGVFRAPGEEESCLNSDPVGELIFRYLKFIFTSLRNMCGAASGMSRTLCCVCRESVLRC